MVPLGVALMHGNAYALHFIEGTNFRSSAHSSARAGVGKMGSSDTIQSLS